MAKDKNQKRIVKYLLASGKIFLFSLLFSLFGIIFIADSLPVALPIIFGILFMIPPIMLIFITGKHTGEKDFKANAKLISGEKSSFAAVEMNYLEILFYVAAFFIPLFICLFLGVILNNTVIHGIVFIVLLPMSLFFGNSAISVITTNPITWLSVAIYLPYLLILCGAFAYGYVYQIKTLRNRRRDIESELRMFNN